MLSELLQKEMGRSPAEQCRAVQFEETIPCCLATVDAQLRAPPAAHCYRPEGVGFLLRRELGEG